MAPMHPPRPQGRETRPRESQQTKVPREPKVPQQAQGVGPGSLPTNQTDAIKMSCLRLCQLIGAACPHNGRTTSALDSIKAGVRLALIELAEAEKVRDGK